MKAETPKRLAILIAVLGVVGGSGFYTQRYQVKRLARKELEKADLAVKKGEFAKAETLFRDHLQVFNDDQEVQIKRADVLLELSRSLAAQSEAFQIYSGILKRSGGRQDVRRSLIKLKFDMGQLVSGSGREDGADVDLERLLGMPENKDDLHLLYLMGRCYEEKGDPNKVYLDMSSSKDDPTLKNDPTLKAVENYKRVVERSDAPNRIEAGARLAKLLRERLHQPKEAQDVINKLVEDAPTDYRGYLARGHFWLDLAARDQSQKSLEADAKKDFEKARELAPKEPDVYLELARIAMSAGKAGYEEARRILEQGFEAAPASTVICKTLAEYNAQAGNAEGYDRAIEVLEKGLRSRPDQSDLRYHLTDLLARRGDSGDTGRLLLQIKELDKAGFAPSVIQYFTAYNHINNKQFLEARRILLTLHAVMNRMPSVLKPRINVLLAQCYKELGEPEMQRNAYIEALAANPNDLTARVGWINGMIADGDTAGAIKEFRALETLVPRVRPVLARLLIEQNQRRPESQRDWKLAKDVIDRMADIDPAAIEPIILRADLLSAQGDQAAARNELEKTQARFPKSVEIRVSLAELLRFQGRFDEAQSLLTRAEQQLGDLVDLRLERARLCVSKKGTQFLKELMDLSQNVETFSNIDRKRLLNGLAIEMVRQQDLEGASRVWTRLAAEDLANIELRMNLVDLALQIANEEEIKKNIKQIEEIEGNEGLLGRYCQVRYLIWQAKRAEEKDKRQDYQLKAHMLLEDLVSKRGDWSVIPLASAELAEEELVQGGLDKQEIRAKEESIINFYLQAIKLGKRPPAVVRRAVELLFKNGQGSRALELLADIPIESQFAGDAGQAIRHALENRDFAHAEQIARKAIQAKPDDFRERFWLAYVLLASERRDDAERELRNAVTLAPDDPDRWVTLVDFMIFTRQSANAEKVIQEAEAKLPPSTAPIALALCCEKMGAANSGAGNDAQMKRWNDAAKEWYEKAQAAQPEDLSIKSRLAEFLHRSGQIDEAKACLDEIIKQGGAAKNVETAAWAKRTLALVLARGTDRTQMSKALALFEANAVPVPAGQEGKTLRDPDDLRALARVLDLQKSLVHRKRAIEILETLTNKSLATSDDRFVLARLYETIDDWPKARESFRELNYRTKNLRDMATLNRRPVYLAQFTNGLLQHRKPDDKEDLAAAQELVDEIKQLQPGALGTLDLQVRIHQIRGEGDQAVALIQAFADRPNLLPRVFGSLAEIAERAKQFELAEQLFRRQATLVATTRSKLVLAAFLGRRDNVKGGLDICEPLWQDSREVELVTMTCIDILFGTERNPRTPDSSQLDRVAGWIDKAIAQTESQKRLPPFLLTAFGILRERQGNYAEAEKLYLRAIQAGDRDGLANNNLAWLVTLKDRKVIEALRYANKAIDQQPNQPDFLDTRGMIYLAAGRQQLALDDLQRAVTIDPSSPSKLFHLAQAQLANNEKEKARQSLDTAKANGFTPGGLHVLEQPNYQSMLGELGSP